MPMPMSQCEMDDRRNTPRVFVACLGCWNASRNVGDWFDAATCPQEADELAANGVFLPWVHYAEGHDELWCLDLDGFDGVQTTECSPAHAQIMAEMINLAEDRGIPREALAYWINDGHDLDDLTVLLDDLQDAYCGEYDDGPTYAAELAEELGVVPSEYTWPVSCIDWAHAWRELELGGDNYGVRTANGTYLIFRAA